MVRYAEWREATDPDRPLARFDGLVQIVASLGGATGAMICCGCLTPLAFGYVWREAGKILLLKRVERLRDVPARRPQLACRLTLFHRGRIYGRDEGLLSLVNGAILFEGRRTSFSVPKNGVRPATSKSGAVFWFDSPAGGCQAHLDALDRNELALAYRAFLDEPSPTVGTIVLPPRRPEVREWRLAHVFRQGSGWLVVLGIAAALSAALAGVREIAIGIVIVAAFLALMGNLEASRRTFALKRLEDPALAQPDD